MKKIFSWVQNNRLFVFTLSVLVIFVARSYSPSTLSLRQNSYAPMMVQDSAAEMAPSGFARSSDMVPTFYGQSTNLNVTDRKVVTQSNISVLVKDVRQALSDVSAEVGRLGGFTVNTSAQYPEEGGSGSVAIRVPVAQVSSMLEFLRQHSIRVISENIMGNDVTDQYTDIQARLATLEKTKATFESMLSKAADIDDILRIQQSIFSVQDQIDNLKGRLQYLENTSSSSLITIHLSTDELALPYSPARSWRPQVIFKTAVRSLQMHLRGVGTVMIWGIVYLPVLLAVIAVIWMGKKFITSKVK